MYNIESLCEYVSIDWLYVYTLSMCRGGANMLVSLDN